MQVLQINMFTEKVYMFVWIICAVVGAVTAVNFLGWVWKALSPQSRYRFVDKYLRMGRRWATRAGPGKPARTSALPADKEGERAVDYVPLSQVIRFVDKTLRVPSEFLQTFSFIT